MQLVILTENLAGIVGFSAIYLGLKCNSCNESNVVAMNQMVSFNA